jgi:hypothetical protein
MRHLWRKVWCVRNAGEPTAKWIGNMVATHGKPCSCASCCNLRGTEGVTNQEKRQLLDKLNDLVQDESLAAIRREVEAMGCSNPLCDCHGSQNLEDIEEHVYEMVTGETAEILQKLNVTVKWASG